MANDSKNPLRVALVFPPAMHPTGPPLGIASLKAYLVSQTPATVRNFDLNLAYYEQAMDWLADRRLKMGLKKMDHGETAGRVLAARDFFRGGRGAEFFDTAKYNAHAGIYTGFETVLNGLFDNFCRKILLDDPVPPLARKFLEGLVEPLKSFGPQLVGFSVLFSQQLFFALLLAKLVRQMGAKTVFGGATFSVMPDPARLVSGPVAVQAGGRERELDPAALIDFLIVGEGEAGLKALVENRGSRKGPFSRVPGLIANDPGGAEGFAPEAVRDLNALPLPDFSDFALRKYHCPKPVLPYLSSRGCPWRRCAFCTHRKTYLDYREENAVASAERLSALKAGYGVSHFCLVDEMVHPRRLDRLTRALARHDPRIFFSAYGRPAGNFTPELLSNAYRSGLRVLMWGVESGSSRVLELMGKGTDIGRVGEILKASHEAGIWNLAFVIFGFPTETGGEWDATLDFLASHRDHIQALSKSEFVLLEGSRIFARPHRFAVTRITDRRGRDPVSIAYDYETSEGLNREQIRQKLRQSAPFLSGIGRSPWFGQFRDHMLIHASESGS